MHRIADHHLDALLAQDIPYGDLTTETLGITTRNGRVRFLARNDMIVCGTEEADRIFQLAGAMPLKHAPSGQPVKAGTVFLTVEGPAGALHRAWKASQNLVEYASGIATAAHRIVEAAKGATVVCTRKSFPGAKEISVKAVKAGGASMHRLGLSETLLVFHEHRLFLADESPEAWVERLRKAQPEKKVVVETDSVEEALLYAKAGADVIQLEHLPPERAHEVILATRALTPAPVIAAAGGVNETNAAAYVAAGCSLIVTSAPFFARPADVKVTFERV